MPKKIEKNEKSLPDKKSKSKKKGNLGIFEQHGWIQHREIDLQVYGNCIFCGSNKFYINKTNKNFHCKLCSIEGGYQTFLRELVNMGIDSITDRQIKKLAAKRGVRVGTLKAHEVGFNPVTQNYIFPEYDINNEILSDVRIYNMKDLISSYGSHPTIYGGHVLNLSEPEEIDVVWLVEGHWDKMVMWEILRKLGKSNHIVVSVPGAGTFKDDWIQLFTDKHVIVVYDNDYNKLVDDRLLPGAGKAGMIKVYNKLFRVVEDIEFIHWLSTYKSGFDISNLYNKKLNSAKKTFKILANNLENRPPDYEKFSKKTNVSVKNKKFSGKGCDISEVYKVFNKHLELINNTSIDVLLGAVIANRLDIDKVWVYLIGPSGSGKTILIEALKKCPSTIARSTLTPASLISGKNYEDGSDPSLIAMLDGGILAIKDFTTILNMNPVAMMELIGILRDAYDGNIAKHFGSGFKEINSKFGLIAAVTHAIETIPTLTALGERFIKFQIPIDSSLKGERAVCKKVMAGILSGKKSAMKEDTQNICEKFLNCEFKKIPSISEKYQNKLISLAQWCGMMRGTITRHQRTERVLFLPMKEYVTRLTSNFTGLSLGLGMVHRSKEMTEENYKIIKKVALNTPPQNYKAIVKEMYLNDCEQDYTISNIQNMINLPSATIKFLVEDLTYLKVLDRKKQKISSLSDKHKWKLTDNIKNLIQETGVL